MISCSELWGALACYDKLSKNKAAVLAEEIRWAVKGRTQEPACAQEGVGQQTPVMKAVSRIIWHATCKQKQWFATQENIICKVEVRRKDWQQWNNAKHAIYAQRCASWGVRAYRYGWCLFCIWNNICIPFCCLLQFSGLPAPRFLGSVSLLLMRVSPRLRFIATLM